MDTTFVDDLGADSLDVFQIIMGIEEELDIEVNVEEAEKIIHKCGIHCDLCLIYIQDLGNDLSQHF